MAAVSLARWAADIVACSDERLAAACSSIELSKTRAYEHLPTHVSRRNIAMDSLDAGGGCNLQRVVLQPTSQRFQSPRNDKRSCSVPHMRYSQLSTLPLELFLDFTNSFTRWTTAGANSRDLVSDSPVLG